MRSNVCKLCDGLGTEKHRLFQCKVWMRLRLQVIDEVRAHQLVGGQVHRYAAKLILMDEMNFGTLLEE